MRRMSETKKYFVLDESGGQRAFLSDMITPRYFEAGSPEDAVIAAQPWYGPSVCPTVRVIDAEVYDRIFREQGSLADQLIALSQILPNS